MAVNYEERMLAEDTRVAKEFEAVVVGAMLRDVQGGETKTDSTQSEE